MEVDGQIVHAVKADHRLNLVRCQSCSVLAIGVDGKARECGEVLTRRASTKDDARGINGMGIRIIGQPSKGITNIPNSRKERRLARQSVLDRRHRITHVDEFRSLLAVGAAATRFPIAAMKIDEQWPGLVIVGRLV